MALRQFWSNLAWKHCDLLMVDKLETRRRGCERETLNFPARSWLEVASNSPTFSFRLTNRDWAFAKTCISVLAVTWLWGVHNGFCGLRSRSRNDQRHPLYG